MQTDSLIIADRFCGPPYSGNGGYVAGRLAAYLDGVASVRLKAPPPLEKILQVEVETESAKLSSDSTLIAEARLASVDLQAPSAPSYAEAEQAAKSYAGFHAHPFPTCFVCGPKREPGDGLRIFPGFVAERTLVAAPWTPDASLAGTDGNIASEFLWAALDCTGAFVYPQVPAGRAIVLGDLAVRIETALRPGEPTVVAAWPLSIDGRKRFVGSAVYTARGDTAAIGRATWIEVPATSFTTR